MEVKVMKNVSMFAEDLNNISQMNIVHIFNNICYLNIAQRLNNIHTLKNTLTFRMQGCMICPWNIISICLLLKNNVLYRSVLIKMGQLAEFSDIKLPECFW